MVASAASTKAPPLSYAEHAKKAQGIKSPNTARQPNPLAPSTSLAQSTSLAPPSKSTTNLSNIDVSAVPTAGPSTRNQTQGPMNGGGNKVIDNISSPTSTSAIPQPPSIPPPPSSTPSSSKALPENVWDRRKEQMASKSITVISTASSSALNNPVPSSSEPASLSFRPPSPLSTEEDPFIVRVPKSVSKTPAPTNYQESWPEVGKSVEASPSINGGAKEIEPTTPKKAGDKPKWVPIPASELQAAADAAATQNRKQHGRSQSRHQATNASRPSPPRQNQPGLSTAASVPSSQNPSQLGSQVSSRNQSGKNSAAHSRMASRATSAQSSPRFARTGRKLEEDSLGLNGVAGVNHAVGVSNNNTNSPLLPPSAQLAPMQPRLDSPQPLLYVDTSGSHPLSYPTPLYGPIPVSGSPYYPNHGPGIPPYPGLPRQQTPSQQGSSSPFRHSPMANLYGLPPGGPNRYPPSNPNHSHSHSLNHSPIPPPTQPPSAYPGAYSPMYPHLYGGMSEYAQGPPYPYWNGHGFAMPGTQSPPYAPPMMPYAPPHIPVHIAQHSQPIDPRPSSLSPDEAIQVQLPPPTMIDHPPPPEESQPVAGYRDVRPVLIGSVAHQANGRSSEPSASVVFGSIDIHDVNNPLSPGPPARTPSSSSSQSSRKEATSQPDASDQLRSAFTAFTIGVSPNDPAPPRMRSRTRSGHSLTDASLSSTAMKQGTSQLAENTTQADKDVVDLTDGTETKWQFGTTNALPPQSETDTDSQLVLETPSTTGLKLPPLPVDLQPTPNMIATDHQPPPVDYDAALGEEFAVKNFGYGFGMIANNGYPLYVQEEPMMRDRPREQDFRDDRARWRDENEVERGGRGGVRDRENGELNGYTGRPRRGSYGTGYGYDRGGYNGRRGRGGYRGNHRARASFHGPSTRQPPLQVTPPHHYQQLMTYNDIPNGYYPPQVPQHQSPINFVPPIPPGGYETYIPQPQQPLPPPAGPIHATPPVPEPITHIGFPLDLVRRYLLGQMEYYMSPQNMSKDFYLRQQMDSRGWIPISVFASFKRVMALTADINLVRDVLILSSIVEVREDWVRMRDWEQFVLPGATPSLIEAAEPLAQPAKSSSHSHDVHDDNEGDVDDEDEEEDVVFVIDDESQRWSPDRRQT